MNSPPIFTSEEIDQNDALESKIIELISSEDAVLFVGSGLSVSLGYPLWNDLLIQLENLAKNVDRNFSPDEGLRESSPLEYASSLKKIFKEANEVDTYFNKLKEIFSQKQLGFKEYHKKLVQLPIPIITTNYDPALSLALSKSIQEKNGETRIDTYFSINNEMVPQLSEFLMSLQKTMKTPKRIAHLHGYHSRPKEIILTKEDYEKFYFNQKEGETKNITISFLVIWSLIATRRIIFIGFGMKDPYLLRLLEDVRKRLWRWDRPTHINISDINKTTFYETKKYAEHLKTKFGVETYFYENDGLTHKKLEILIEKYYNFFCQKKKHLTSEKKLEKNINTSSNKIWRESTQHAPQILESENGISEWILSTNKKLNPGIIHED